jgi:LuxR family maltose regulon positive regulatory protein
MQGREDISGFIKDLKGDSRYIMDYLLEEVLKIQTDDIKEFLLQTSILAQMSAPLCNAVLNRNDSQLILETLEKNNMFVIPLDEERVWYRYHHLFAKLLNQRLQQKDKESINDLHNKAGEWFKNNAMPLLAIEHAIKTENFEKSLLFFGEIVETMWKNGQHAAIMKYGDLLPDELIKKNADFCLYYAWILIIAGQIQKAEPFLVSAEKITMQIINDKNSSIEDVRYNKKMLGKISVAFAYMNSLLARSEKIFDYSKTAMENLSEDDPLWFSWGWYSIGIAHSVRENFKGSIDAYEKALEYGKKSGNIYLISTIAINLVYIESRMGLYNSAYKKCSDLLTFMKESSYLQIAKSESTFAGLYSCMAGIEYMRTDFDDALENIKTAYNLCKNESNNSFKVVVLTVYSSTLFGRGDPAGALKMLTDAEDIIKQNKIAPVVVSIFIALKGILLIELNQLDKANNFFKEYGLRLDKEISYLDENGYCPYALLLIIEMKFGEAEILLSKLLKLAQAANRIERIIEIKVIYAILNKASGDKEKALVNLIEALEYSSNDNILMAFIDNLDRIRDLLDEIFKIQAITKTKIPKKLIDKLKLAIEKKEKHKKINVEADLSARELDALKLIAENLTNQEIADKLFISLNTVKTHAKNIFLKLEVDSRIQAVTKAKELGII